MIGPAGSGKTTLLRALADRDPGILAGVPLDRATHLRCVAACLARFGPDLVSWRGLDRGRLRSMAYLEGWHRVLARGRVAGWSVLLDHGPLYRLAQLGEGGPRPGLDRWREGHLERWRDTLDLLVWLDAPTATLEQRIRTRDRWHLLKDRPAGEWEDLLGTARAGLEDLVRRVSSNGRVELLRFDTAVNCPDRIASLVRHALEARRAGLTV